MAWQMKEKRNERKTNFWGFTPKSPREKNHFTDYGMRISVLWMGGGVWVGWEKKKRKERKKKKREERREESQRVTENNHWPGTDSVTLWDSYS